MTDTAAAKGLIETALASRLRAITADLSLAPVSIRLHLFRASIDRPMKTVFGTMLSRPALLVAVEDRDGTTGTGEIWCNFPLIGAEYRRNLAQNLLPELVTGKKFANPAAVTDRLLSLLHTLGLQAGENGPVNQIVAGLDVALWDLVARRARLPLYQLFGGSRIVPVYASSIPSDQPLRCADAAVARGHVALKLRIGFGIERDVSNLETLRRRFGSQVAIMVDANQAWSLDTAQTMVSVMADFAPAWLEEPLPADRHGDEWLRLKEITDIALAGGENLRGFVEFKEAVEGGHLDVCQPDLGKWGGLSGTLVVADRTLASKRRFCPHWLAGGVGFAASLHLQGILGGNDFVEFDANPNPLRELIFDPKVEGGVVRLSDEWGHGACDAVAKLGCYEI